MSGEANKKLKKLVCAGIAILAIAGCANEARADIVTWYYEDDFSTRKAEGDSYSHSLFRSEVLNVPPMPEPELQPNLYYAFYHNRWYDHPLNVLLFKGASDGNEPAFLAYAFPLDSQLVRVDSGTVVFRTPMSCPPCLDLRPSGLSYELSEDGINWTNPSELFEGPAQISLLPSNNSFTYIRFSGREAMLESLSVTVTGPEIPEPVDAEININPNTLNLHSKGKWITCFIWLPEDYNVADIEPNTVRLEETIAAEWIWFEEQEQVAMVKFSRSDVRRIVSIGDEVELSVSGQLLDGTRFEGADTIKVIDKGRK